MSHSRIAAASIACALATSITAQSATILYQTGDLIFPGLGDVATIGRFAINDTGEWLILVESDALPEEESGVMLRNGFPTLQEGTPLALPAGSYIDEFRSVTLDAEGASGWEFEINSADGGPLQALYAATRLLALEGDPMNTLGYSNDAVWLKFEGSTKVNDAHQLLVACTVADPSLPGTEDDALVLFDLDATGELLAIRDILHETGPLPGQEESVRLGPAAPTSIALNNAGDVMFLVRMQGDITTDRAIYINETIIAQEGAAAPIPGLAWRNLSGAALDLNDTGNYGFRGKLTGANNRQRLIVRDGEALARQRSPVPGLPLRLFENFGEEAPIHVSSAGDLFYFADWNGDEDQDRGLFVNDELIVREGFTAFDGVVIDTLTDSSSLFGVSPGGRYVLFRARLRNVSHDAVIAMIDLGRVTPLQDCGGNQGRLFRRRGFPVTGSVTTLGLDEGQTPGVRPFLFISTELVASPGPCGVGLPFGELLVAFGPGTGNPIDVLLGTPWGDEAVEIDLPIPNEPGLIDLVLYAQAVFFDLGGQLPGPDFRLTNAVEIEIGAP